MCLFIISNLKKKSVTIAPDTVLSPRIQFFPLRILLFGFRLTWLFAVLILQFNERP